MNASIYYHENADTILALTEDSEGLVTFLLIHDIRCMPLDLLSIENCLDRLNFNSISISYDRFSYTYKAKGYCLLKRYGSNNRIDISYEDLMKEIAKVIHTRYFEIDFTPWYDGGNCGNK